MLRRNWKTLLISVLSFSLLSCAGKPPAMERPIALYRGNVARQALCQQTKARVKNFIQQVARYQRTKKYAPSVLDAALLADTLECVKADSDEFGTFFGIRADDLRVLLQYQENLLYKCEKWKQ